MRFPPSFLERLRSQLIVSEVLGRRIQLKKHGREFQALCPFHNEKTPSFTINDDKNFYHCFGCGAHGDAISFVMKYDRMSYPEAVEHLAREAGIPLPVLTREEAQRAEREKIQLHVLEAACRWFEQQLAQNMAARQYVEKRGLLADTTKRFRIGYAPDERNALHQHLLKAGYPQALQLEAGLIGQSEEGHVYDRFRGRVMFPIRTPRGDIIAFGGRLIIDDKNKTLPKYLNSPETPLFKKGEMLFNLDLAKRAIRDRGLAVVMEGYMDVVSVTQSGVEYAVATLGTAVTPDHLKLLWRLCKEPVLCLDGDAAGKRAMTRAAEVALPLLAPGYSLRFAMLPKGEDPDSYVQKYGSANFEEILRKAQDLYHIVWENLFEQHAPKLALPEGRAALESACRQTVDKIQDASVKKHYADFFRSQVWEKVRKAPWANTERSLQVTQLAAIDNPQTSMLDALIARMLSLLIDYPALLHKSSVEETLPLLETKDRKISALRDVLLAAIPEHGLEEREHLIGYLDGQLPAENKLASITAKRLGSPVQSLEAAWQIWNDCAQFYQDEKEAIRLQAVLETEWNEADHAHLTDIKRRQANRAIPPESDVA
jgi:DNA primase